MTAKKTIHNIFGASKMENYNTFEQIVRILEQIRDELKVMNLNQDAQKEKVAQKEKENNSNLGGIIGGESIGGIRGKREGGKKGGDLHEAKPSKAKMNALSDFNADELALLEKLNQELFRHLDEQQIAYLSTREQKVHALKALRKLERLGYSEAFVEQALFNAFRDAFWNDKIRHLKALANTMKNGELVIMNLLKKNQAQTKINAPVHAQYKG